MAVFILNDFLLSNSGMNPLVTAAIRTVFGCEPEQLNALFALTYAQAGGGFMRLTLTEPGCAQEKKIKVRLNSTAHLQ